MRNAIAAGMIAATSAAAEWGPSIRLAVVSAGLCTAPAQTAPPPPVVYANPA